TARRGRRNHLSNSDLAYAVSLSVGSRRQVRHDHRAEHERERDRLVPAQTLAEIEPRERHEHEQRDDFLDDLELRCRELTIADAVRRHLKTVLEERQEPGYEDHLPQSRLAESEMAVPGGGHEDVRGRQQCDGFHSSMVTALRLRARNLAAL